MSEGRSPIRRKETIMEQRIRKARGEDVDDTIDDLYEDDYTHPRARHMPDVPYDPYRPSMGIPWTFYVIMVGLAILVIVFLFQYALGGIRDSIDQLKPQVPSLASPTPTFRTSSAAILKRVQQLNRLETTSYTIEKVIEAGIEGNVFQNWLYGDRLLLIANGTVTAGFDLSTLQENAVTISEDGRSITFYLPPVQVFDATLDNSKTRVYDRQQGLLAPENKDLETQARQVAEQQILQAACDGGLLERANEDGKRSMEQFLRILDFDYVEVIGAPVPACPDYQTLKNIPPTPSNG